MRTLTIVAIALVLGCGCSTINEQAIKDQLKDKLPAIGDYVDKPEPVEDGPVDDLDLSTVRWLGSNYAGAPITTTLRSAKLDSRIHYDVDIPASWPTKTYNGKPCVAMLCIFYERDGGVVGGKLDHSKPRQTSQDLKNTRNGYNGHTPIPADSRVWLCVVEQNGKERSNVVAVSR